MKEAAIIAALIILTIGLRLGQKRILKKVGAFVFLSAMGYLGYAVTHHWVGIVVCVLICALLPLAFIYTKRSQKTYHLKPKPLNSFKEVDEAFYPHAGRYRAQLEELGFDNAEESSWQWLETHQHHKFFWHPEYCSIASICLCEQDNVTFSFIIFYSELSDGTTIKTTNYPFSSPLSHPPKSHWCHVPCEEKDISVILKSHQNLIHKHNTNPCTLRLPEPDEISDRWVEELTKQTEYNLSKKLIRCNQQQFHYTPLGYLYLWVQAVKDFIRLC